jgi:tight adherence protein B
VTDRPLHRPSRAPRVATRRPLAVLLAGVLFVAGVLQFSVAAAQDDADAPASPPELMAIDAGEDPYLLLRAATEPTDVQVVIAGEEARTTAPVGVASTGIPITTAIVIDNSSAAEADLSSFLAAATDYVDRASPNEQISVWTSGGAPRLRVGLNSNHDRTAEIVDEIVAAAGGNLIYDAVRSAALDLGLEDTVPGATNLFVLSGSVDGGSVASLTEARGATQSIGASVFAVASNNLAETPLRSLASGSFGGAFAATGVADEIAGYGASVSQVVKGTYRIGFSSPQLAETNQIRITVDGTEIRATYTPGSITSGSALAPFVDPGDGGIPGLGFLGGDTGRTLGLVLGALAAGLGAYAVVQLMQKDESALTSVLQAYNDPMSPTADAEEDEESGLAKNALLQRAVQMTEDLAERRGFLSRLESMLERADLPLRAGEALTATAGLTVLGFVLGILLFGNLPGILILTALFAVAPTTVVRMRAAKRQKAFMAQLPDTLQLLSSTLKAGYSFMQGVEAVSQEVEDPMGSELRRIVTEAQLGRPLEDAMDASAERMDSPDFSWAVMAVKIQREVGGNLSELLLTVAETMTERERLRRDVATLTAEGKMSAIILGALPILLGMAMWAINPEYIETLFTDGFGKVLLGLSVFAAISGFAWMKKIINIDI